jgi:hypothetical protein
MNKAKKKVNVRDLKPSKDAKGGRHGHGHHHHARSGGDGAGPLATDTLGRGGRHQIQ